MSNRTRMSSDERRDAIINAARPLFAEKGFNGTSVRHIAKAAGVSEALLYKHFPSKDALYREILSYTGRLSNEVLNELKDLEPGTETLILLVYVLFQFILFDVPGNVREQKMHERLLFYSLLEDASYATIVFDSIHSAFNKLARRSFDIAVKKGDVIRLAMDPMNRFWFVHHLAMALNLCHLSGNPAFKYEGTREHLAEDAILFAVRGAGITDEALDRYYRPKKFRQIMTEMMSG